MFDYTIARDTSNEEFKNTCNLIEPSIQDIKVLFGNGKLESSIILGHDGTVIKVSDPDRKKNIELVYNTNLNVNFNLTKHKGLAKLKTLQEILESDILKYTRR